MKLLSLYDFRKLNNLTPTVNSTFTKLEEEKGEVAEIVGKLRCMNGEKNEKIDNLIIYQSLLEELMDMAQVCATMVYIINDTCNMSINDVTFDIDDSCNSFSYFLKKIAIIQGDIANFILNISDGELIDNDLSMNILPLFLKICELSCNCIYFVCEVSNIDLDTVKKSHINKLISRGYVNY